MNFIQAIPTRHKGRLFRSRLEARWSIAFDAMKIRWRYELEGFKSDETGFCYLPDFHFPDQEMWIEIKPDVPDEREMGLMADLTRGLNTEGVILAGEPWPLAYSAYAWFKGVAYGDTDGRWKPEVTKKGTLQLAKCRKCSGLCLIEDASAVGDIGPYAWGNIGRHACPDHDRRPVVFGVGEFGAAMEASF